MKKIINISLAVVTSLLLSACTSSSDVVPERSPNFKLGEKDGCVTATGNYTKNSESFKTDTDYKNGWFYGRKNCNPSQKA